MLAIFAELPAKCVLDSSAAKNLTVFSNRTEKLVHAAASDLQAKSPAGARKAQRLRIVLKGVVHSFHPCPYASSTLWVDRM
ncbi:hypothetical protein ACVWZW_004909 [Bradyrhizobium sp. F1.13.4]